MPIFLAIRKLHEFPTWECGMLRNFRLSTEWTPNFGLKINRRKSLS